MRTFDPRELGKLRERSEEPENGQVTIIGGSDLFHGAPILSLKVASRVVDMVYFSSPEPSVGRVAEQLKAQLSSFIWVPWDEVDAYIEKSDAVLIGPGMKRWHKERLKIKYQQINSKNWKSKTLDEAGAQTKLITQKFLQQFRDKHWVIDGGSLQVMEASWIPQHAILTPNKKEFKLLFGLEPSPENTEKMAKEHSCTVVLKGPVTYVCSPKECVEVRGGNPGLTKGGTGDVLAGTTVALLAQNEPFLAAAASSWAVKKAADRLGERAGTVYNADDLAEEVPRVLGGYLV